MKIVIGMGYYLIKVEGEILANSKVHYAQGWSCISIGDSIDGEGSYKYDSKTHTVKGNLILNENRRSVPYAVYYGEKAFVQLLVVMFFIGLDMVLHWNIIGRILQKSPIN